ncbi:SIDT2 protein, partial [Sylvietta virens]|nr:SIDT2 protein [Sylvietta virens]
MSGAGAAVLAWALLAGALLPAPPVRPQPLPRGDRKVQEKEAQFNTTYIDWVDANLLNIYAFNHSVRRNRTEGVRVSVNVLSDQKDRPVLFVVRQKEAVVSFQVPLILRGLYQRKYAYQEVSRTLCQPQTKAEVETQHFYVDVSTLSLNTSYQLRVTRVENFVLRTNERFSFNATAAQPQYFKYKFPEEVDSVIVKVTSAMAFPCSVISIQDILCPVYDLDNNVAFIGMYQTMTKKAAITVQKKDFPSHSFYVVVVVKTEDEACGGALPFYPLSKDASPDEPVDQHNRQKTLEVMVSPAITSEAYVRSVLFCLGIFLSFYILTLLIACWESCRQHKRKGLLAAMDSPSLDTGHSRSIPNAFLNHGPYDSYGYGSFGNGSSSSTEGITDSLGSAEVSYSYVGQEQFKRRTPSAPTRPLSIAMGERSLENVAGRPRLDSLSSVEEDDYDTLADIDYDKNVIRTKVRVPPPALPAAPCWPGKPLTPLSFQQYLCVADLARKDKRVLRKKYQIYFWNIATIAVFYALPVIQLVITYQTVVNVTGNQDICYYNFLCAHPLGNLSAFNNILSNLGYVLLGLLFLLIILQREINYNRALLRNDAHALECGIPKHFGLFYAMGTALMMEGLLSACYHVCPNYTNFQFGECPPGSPPNPHRGHPRPSHLCAPPDTSFMYMIAGLCMLKLYQKRHPDINASAYSAYACLALVIFFSVVGVVFGKGNTAFWIVFSVIHIVATLLLSTQLYYMGRWKLDSGILRRILHVLYTDCVRQCSGPMYVDRMVLLVMGNIINWSLAAYGLIVRPNDFASYLLAIGICNLLLYFAFYIIMKLRSGERIKLIPLLCIISTSVVWGFALFFFFQGLSTWQKTPAESREHNRDCILLDFFDDHDIWHFLSSIAMFGSFLVLLTLDDDLDCVQRDKIYVF